LKTFRRWPITGSSQFHDHLANILPAKRPMNASTAWSIPATTVSLFFNLPARNYRHRAIHLATTIPTGSMIAWMRIIRRTCWRWNSGLELKTLAANI
jgi:hypothetical protein